jgi:7-cyano-7-deazaguanine synthase in queuosine biosynthesis
MSSNIITKSKETVKNKSVLLFSGGMDSVMFDKLLEPDVLLYIPSGSAYEEIETLKLHELANNGWIDWKKLVILDETLNLKSFERDDMIVPNRNAYLVLLASHYGEKIYLGSVYGDRSFDKDKTFYGFMENLLNHIWQEQHWTEQRRFTVESPYKDVTKTELVEEYIKAGGYVEALMDSYSCYSGDLQPCGICKPCFRKAVSLINNKIYIPEDYYKANPFTAEWLVDVLPEMKEGKYRGREDKETLDAINEQQWLSVCDALD